jgi:hypothetical protein
MSATTIIDTAPLGALIRYTDGTSHIQTIELAM